MEIRFIAASLLVSALCIAMLMAVVCNTYDSSYNVSMILVINSSGLAYTGFADNFTADGTYTSSNISHYYLCFNTSQNYVTGIAFMGTSFNHMILNTSGSNYSMKLSQFLAGNEFEIPVTQMNCQNMSDKINETSGYINGPFYPFAGEGNYTITVVIRYPSVDFVSAGDYEDFEAGEYSVSLEKNETGNVTQIIFERG